VLENLARPIGITICKFNDVPRGKLIQFYEIRNAVIL